MRLPCNAGSCLLHSVFQKPGDFLKRMLSEPPLLALSVCIPVPTTAALCGLYDLCGPAAEADVPSTLMERRLDRIALLGLRSWSRDRNCIFKLTFARIGARRYSAASLACSFLPSPLSLHKPCLNNRGINPVEVSASGNKTTSCNLSQVCDVVFHPATWTCVPTGGRAGEEGENCLSGN